MDDFNFSYYLLLFISQPSKDSWWLAMGAMREVLKHSPKCYLLRQVWWALWGGDRIEVMEALTDGELAIFDKDADYDSPIDYSPAKSRTPCGNSYCPQESEEDGIPVEKLLDESWGF